MQPLNPVWVDPQTQETHADSSSPKKFLSAFFNSALPGQCTHIHQHILLVPTTEVLLTSRDRESGALYADLVSSEDFLGSHVLRCPSIAATTGGKDVPSIRENRGKAKQYTTINGRTVVIKDAFVYSNKGFKNFSQAHLLADVLWYPDTIEPRQWLVYYISRPLFGIFQAMNIVSAKLPAAVHEIQSEPLKSPKTPGEALSIDGLPRKNDVNTFNDLLINFPMIDRQMQPGLNRLFKEFRSVFEKALPPPPSAMIIPDPVPNGRPIAAAMKGESSNNLDPTSKLHVEDRINPLIVEDSWIEDDEEVMRGALETAVTAAIDLFQMVDKQQLSLLGVTTELTGPVVERLIERYVAEQVHDSILWPGVCSMKRREDLELELKIRQMAYIDVSQVGILIHGGRQGKHEVIQRLGRAVEEFRKLDAAGSPQQMMDVLLATLKTVTRLTEAHHNASGQAATSEKSTHVLTVNADTLVSLLLVVVIRAQVRYLLARLLYMRHFIFIDDVESGEMGYALSTFEAVLSYLAQDSGSLRKASRRNNRLWQATKHGDIKGMKKIMEPEKDSCPDGDENDHDEDESTPSKSVMPEESWRNNNGKPRQPFGSSGERPLQNSTLNHIYPFQIQDGDSDHEREPPSRKPKSVTMDTRSMSSNSETSFCSRTTTTTIDSKGSSIEGDTSIERLSQTEDSLGESVPMMAIQNKRPEALKYLLSLQDYYPSDAMLDDINNEKTTLLSAAVQLGHTEIINLILDYIFQFKSEATVIDYLSRQDTRGRSVAHYLFNAPGLVKSVGRLLPWRQKDSNGQTPIFALCRSYDHGNYREMVEEGLAAATLFQGDGQPLHLDDHVDIKGNTLLHIINDPQMAMRLLMHCDCDVNAINDKKFTALMVASKYGRLDMVRALFGDPRVDLFAKELRGLTAVELAKDDEVRNRIDDLMLFTGTPASDGRLTSVVRAFFVEDATIRLVVKSAAPSSTEQSYTITTCRRSQADFEHLAKLLSLEHPASWLPSISGMRSPFQFVSNPSRAVLRDIQVRLNEFLTVMLAHSTFSTHEMLWEFFLVPELQTDAMEARSKLKAETRMENVREEYHPTGDVRDVEQFVDHARDTVRAVNLATKNVARRSNMVRVTHEDFHDACALLSRAINTLEFLPSTHQSAINTYLETLVMPTWPPYASFHSSILSMHSTIIAMLLSLSRPISLISCIITSRRAIERSYNSISRSTRWPLGLLDETRQRLNEEKEEKVRKSKNEVEQLGKELRYTQQVVAGELAGWQDLHERMGRRTIRDLARGMVVRERAVLEGLQRAVRKTKAASVGVVPMRGG